MTLTRLLGTVTSRLSTGRSPLPSLDITTASTGLLCWRDLHPQEWQLASLHPLNTDSTRELDSSGRGRHPLGWTKLAELLAVVNRGARLGIAADQLVLAVCVIVVHVAVVALAVSSSTTGHPRPSAPFWPVVFPALGRLTRFDRLVLFPRVRCAHPLRVQPSMHRCWSGATLPPADTARRRCTTAESNTVVVAVKEPPLLRCLVNDDPLRRLRVCLQEQGHEELFDRSASWLILW